MSPCLERPQGSHITSSCSRGAAVTRPSAAATCHFPQKSMGSGVQRVRGSRSAAPAAVGVSAAGRGWCGRNADANIYFKFVVFTFNWVLLPRRRTRGEVHTRRPSE